MGVYRKFDDWWGEIENFSLRSERATADLGPMAQKWLMIAWGLGAISSERTSDGHAAEAAKDVRNAGWPEAADIIEQKTIPESQKIIRHNIREIAKENGIE